MLTFEEFKSGWKRTIFAIPVTFLYVQNYVKIKVLEHGAYEDFVIT